MDNSEKTIQWGSQQADHATKKDALINSPTTLAPLFVDEDELCRICRQDDSDLPLYHPCKCSGSIRFVHQPCLDSWLSRRATNRCELCSVMILYRSVYPRNLPKRLSHLQVFKAWYARLVEGRVVWLRVTFVFFMWLAALPLFSLISCRFLLFGFFPYNRLLISLSGLPRLVAIGALFPLGGVCMFALESVLDTFVSEIYKFYLWWRQQSNFTSSSTSLETDEPSQQTRSIIDLRPIPETPLPTPPPVQNNQPPIAPLVVGRVVALGANTPPAYHPEPPATEPEDDDLPAQQRPQPSAETSGLNMPTASTPTTDTSSPREVPGPRPTNRPRQSQPVQNRMSSESVSTPVRDSIETNRVPLELGASTFTNRPANNTEDSNELMELIGLRGPILRSLFCMSLVWIGSCSFICLLLLVPYGIGKGWLHVTLEKEVGQTFFQNSQQILPGISHDLVEHSHRVISDTADLLEITQDTSSPVALTELDCLILEMSEKHRGSQPGWTELCETGTYSSESSLKYALPVKFVHRSPFFLASGRSLSAWNEWFAQLTPDFLQIVSRRWSKQESKLKLETVQVDKLFADVLTVLSLTMNSVNPSPDIPLLRLMRTFSLPSSPLSSQLMRASKLEPEYPTNLPQAKTVVFEVSHLFRQEAFRSLLPNSRLFTKLQDSFYHHNSTNVENSNTPESVSILREWRQMQCSVLNPVREISAEAGKKLVLAPEEGSLRAWRGGPAFGKRENSLIPGFQERSFMMEPIREVELTSDPSMAMFGQGNIELEVLGMSHVKRKLELPYTIVGYLQLYPVPKSKSLPASLSLQYTLRVKLHPFPLAFQQLTWTAVIWLVGLNRSMNSTILVAKTVGILALVVTFCLVARDWVNAVRGVQEITAAEEEEQAKAAAAATIATSSLIPQHPTVIWRLSSQLESTIARCCSKLKLIMEPRPDTRTGAVFLRVQIGASVALRRSARGIRYIVWDIAIQSMWKVARFFYSLVIFILSFQELLFNMGLNYVLEIILPITMGRILMSLAGASYWLQIPSSWSAWHMDENTIVITVVSHCIGGFYLRLVAKMVFRSLEVLQMKYAEAIILGNYSLLGFFVFSFVLLRGGSATGGHLGEEESGTTMALHSESTRSATRRSRSRVPVRRSRSRDRSSNHTSVESICRAFFSTASWGDLTQGLLSFLTAHVIVLAVVVFLSSVVTQVFCPRLLPLVVIPYAVNPVELHRPWSFEIYRVIVALKRLLIDVSLTNARKIMPLTQCLVHTTMILAFLRVWNHINSDDAKSSPSASHSTRHNYSRSGESQAYYLKCLAAYITYTSGFGHCLTPVWRKWLSNFNRHCEKDISQDGSGVFPVRSLKRKLNDRSARKHPEVHRWKSSRSIPDSRIENPVNMSPATSLEWRIESEELSRSAPLHLLSASSGSTAERRAERRAESGDEVVPSSSGGASSLSSVSRLRVQHTTTVCEELDAASPNSHTRVSAQRRRLWGATDLQSSGGSAGEHSSSDSDDDVSDSPSQRDNRSSFSELDVSQLGPSSSLSPSSSTSSSSSSSSPSSSSSSSSVSSSSASPSINSSQRSSTSNPYGTDEEALTRVADDDSSSAGEFENTCLWVRRTHRGMALPRGWVVKEVASRVFKNLEKIYIADDRVMAVDCRLESGTHTTFRTGSFNKNDFIMAGVFVARVWNAAPLRTGTMPAGTRDSYSENFEAAGPSAAQSPLTDPLSSRLSSSKEDIQFQVWMPKTEIPNTDLGHVRFAASKIFMTFEPNVIIQDEGRSLSFPYKARGFYMTRNHESSNVSGMSSSSHSDDASTTYTFRYVVAEGPKGLIAEEFGGLPAPFRWKGRSIEPLRQLVRSIQVISACAWPALLLLVALVLATSLCVATSILCGRQLVRFFFGHSSWLKSSGTVPYGLDRILLQYHTLAMGRATSHPSNFYLEPQGRLTDEVKQAGILSSRVTDLVTFAMGLSFLYLCILSLTHIRSRSSRVGGRERARHLSNRRMEYGGMSYEEELGSPLSSREHSATSNGRFRAQTGMSAPGNLASTSLPNRSNFWRRWRTSLVYSCELLRNLQVKTRTLVINGMSDWRRTVFTRVRPIGHQAAFFVGLVVFYVSMPLCLGGFLDLLVLRPTLYRFDGGRTMSSVVLHFAVQWWLIGLPGFTLWWGSLISINFGVWLRPLLLTGSTDLPDRDTLREIGNLSVRFLSRRHRIQCDTVKKFYCKFLAPLLRDWLYWFGAPLLITVAGCILDLVLQKKFFIREEGGGLQKPLSYLLSLHQNTIQIFVSFRALRTLFKHAKDDFQGVYQRLWEQKFLVKKELLNFNQPRE